MIFGNFMGKFTNSMGCCHISPRGATLSFTLRSKGEGGQPRYLIIQEIASHFSTPPHPPLPRLPRTLRADSNIVIYSMFVLFGSRNHILLYGETSVNTSVFARCWPKTTVNTVRFATRSKKHRKYRGFGLPIHPTRSLKTSWVFFPWLMMVNDD